MDFVIVGPEKTGTGWIDAALREHAPAMLPSVTKETFYLDRLFHLGPAWHAGLYANPSTLRGEVSPSYFASPEARKRLLSINPHARVVIILRNPYTRMASHLLHRMRRGVGRIQGADIGLDAAHWEEARQASNYQRHGAAWRAEFGEAVKFVRYKDIHRRPGDVLNSIADHIGLDWSVDPVWAVHFGRRRVFESAVPSSAFLARTAYFMSRRLQEMGATRLVAAVRRSGVRKLFERPGAGVPADLRERVEQIVRAQEDFERDIDFAEQVLEMDLGEWRKAAIPIAALQRAHPDRPQARHAE